MYTKKSLKTTENTEHIEKMERDSFTEKIIGCALEVHKNLGPGLLESTYKQCLATELISRNIKFFLEHPVPVNYKGIQLECGYRIDILCESSEQN